MPRVDRLDSRDVLVALAARLRDAARDGLVRRIRLVNESETGRMRTVGYAWELLQPPVSGPATLNDRTRRVRERGLGIGAVLTKPDGNG